MRKELLIVTSLVILFSNGCSDEGQPVASEPITVSDAQLFAMQQTPGDWTFFGSTPDTLSGGSTTAHEPRLRVRYNARAATQLNGSGRVITGAVFPDSSLIIKDLYTGSVRTTIAYMFKLSGASNAASGGWVWAETDDAGTPKISASRRGTGCVGCHMTGIDFTRMNDAHP